jgi:hypothetical protein
MTNKLPVIGKRYKSINQDWIVTVNSVDEYRVGVVESGVWHPAHRFFEMFEELPDQEPTKEPVVKKPFTTDKVQEALEELEETIKDYLPCSPDNESFDLLVAARYLIRSIEEKNHTDKEDLAENTPKNGLKVPIGMNAIEEQKEEKTSSEPSKEDGYRLAEAGDEDNQSKLYWIEREGKIYVKEKTSKSIWKPISELPDEYAPIHQEYIIIKYGDGRTEMHNINGRIDYLAAIKKQRFKEEYCTMNDFINQVQSQEKRIARLELLTLNK